MKFPASIYARTSHPSSIHICLSSRNQAFPEITLLKLDISSDSRREIMPQFAPVLLPKIGIMFLVSQECLNHAEKDDNFLTFKKIDLRKSYLLVK